MSLIIDNFQKGLSQSPYVMNGAYSKSANLDIHGQTGIARINYLPIAATQDDAIDELAGSFTLAGSFPNFATMGNNIYTMTIPTYPAIDTITKIGDNKGNFCMVWENYLITARYNVLNAYGSGGWHQLVGELENTAHHYMFYSKNDGKLYICNGKYVAILAKKTDDFNPEGSNTYELTKDAFELPNEYTAYAISEIGGYIVIAANYETGNYWKTAYFLWDGDLSTADAIYEIEEQNIATPLAHGNAVYLTGGQEGIIYKLTTGGIEPYAQIPFDYDKNKADISYFHRNQLGWWNNKLIVGVGSFGANRVTPAGIYSVKNGITSCEHLISTGEDATDKEVLIGGVFGLDSNTLLWSWRTEKSSVKTFGIDVVKTQHNRVSSYGCYFESLLYPVGTKANPKSYNNVEVQLARPLQDDEGVRIKYRQSASGDWTTLDTQDYSTYGVVSSLSFPGIHNLEKIQIRCELTTGATANTPYLLSIILQD